MESRNNAPTLRKDAILSYVYLNDICIKLQELFCYLTLRPRNRQTMQELNKLVDANYNLKIKEMKLEKAGFSRSSSQHNYYCPIKLEYIFSNDDEPLKTVSRGDRRATTR